jgi:arylsulfatase A-like enzyme
MKTRLINLYIILFAAIAWPSAEAAKRPNVVFIFTDDQRPDAFGAVGNPDVKTPNMDRLFHNGFVFKQAYIQGSMTFATCLPSRAMLMSGKSLFRAPMRLDSGTILPQALRKGGYHTFATGKWHNGELSFENSFDEAEAVFFGGAARSHIGVPVHRMIAGLMVPYDSGESFSTELFADAATEYIESREKIDKPFFCYIPVTAPHSPVTPPGKWATMYDPEKITLPPNHVALRPDLALRERGGSRGGGRGGRGRGGDENASPVERAKQDYAKYYGLISHLDHHVGRVLDTLEKTGQADNTIVVLATDHGMSKSSHGASGKNNAYEHTSRVQMVFSGAAVPNGSSDALVYLYDIYPTLCGLAGLPTPDGVEGKSLAGIIRGKADKVREHLFTAYMQDQRTIRDDRWKLFLRGGDDRVALYDLKNDPHELNDLAKRPEQAKRIDKLKSALAKARAEYGDTDEAVARLMRSRGGRPGGGRSGGGGRRPSGGGAPPTIDATGLAKRVAEKLLDRAEAESGLAKRGFESAWAELHTEWRDGESATSRNDLIRGFVGLLGDQTTERSGRPSGPSAVVARAFSYATDSDGDREITAGEVQSAAKKWASDGDKNADGRLSAAEIASVIEGFIQAMPAPRGRRR